MITNIYKSITWTKYSCTGCSIFPILSDPLFTCKQSLEHGRQLLWLIKLTDECLAVISKILFECIFHVNNYNMAKFNEYIFPVLLNHGHLTMWSDMDIPEIIFTRRLYKVRSIMVFTLSKSLAFLELKANFSKVMWFSVVSVSSHRGGWGWKLAVLYLALSSLSLLFLFWNCQGYGILVMTIFRKKYWKS